MEPKDPSRAPTPSQFMRQLRPELYSDSTSRIQYRLKAEVLSHHLDTLTERNQTHDFELFCRKLCERTICPNLRPATGPEGGGDSKADTETIPVADEISKLTYVGIANSGSERWAFAFSAKKTWSQKAKSDIAGIVAMGRGYQRIIFVTSRAARAKDRARLEDELSKKHGIPVTIHDRAWIIDEVIDKDRRDLAFHYLGVGEESSDRDLGPSDYSRSKQLAEIERELADPTAFVGMQMQRASEALVAAKLARSLELPRTDVDGRFLRAVRLANDGGTHRQQLGAHYESLWTAFWWFDDIQAVVSGYEAFEELVLDDTHAGNLELLCNLAQLLFNVVISGQVTPAQAQLEPRIARLASRLVELAGDAGRPNNSLEAKTSLLTIQVNQAILAQDADALSSLWPQFADVLMQAEGLGEFDAARLAKLLEGFGQVAGEDRGYRDLVDQLAEFMTKRSGDSPGAMVWLRRAHQLSFDQNMEMIRLLGRAAHVLSKKEHAEEQVQALAELAVAYKSAGLAWAARASATSAAATMFVNAEGGSELPASSFPILMNVAWMAVALKHLPEVLDTIQVARGCLAALPFDDESVQRAGRQLEAFDMTLACQLVNLSDSELSEFTSVPDILLGLGLNHSWSALMYKLGYEDLLRKDGWIPDSESVKEVASLFDQMAGHPTDVARWRPTIFNGHDRQVFTTRVLGLRVDVAHEPTDTSITIAESIAGAVDAFFATAFELEAFAHVERFDVSVVEAQISGFEIEPNLDAMQLTVRCAAGIFPGSPSVYGDFQRMLLEVAATIFWATCHTRHPGDAASRLLQADAASERLAMIGSLCLSRHRIFGGVSRLDRWSKYAPKDYAVRTDRPTVVPLAPQTGARTETDDEQPGDQSRGDLPEVTGLPTVTDHRDVQVRSVIDVHLWDQAGWIGTAYGSLGPAVPPFLALMFRNEAAAAKIFERWRDRFGERDDAEEIYIGIIREYSVEHPTHYGVVLTSTMPSNSSNVPYSTVVSRSQSMEPADDVNLTRFLGDYQRAGAYLLMPMVLTSNQSQPKLLKELFLLKRGLHVKLAAEVSADDPENMFLEPRGLGSLQT